MRAALWRQAVDIGKAVAQECDQKFELVCIGDDDLVRRMGGRRRDELVCDDAWDWMISSIIRT
jgi:hypothetical protein